MEAKIDLITNMPVPHAAYSGSPVTSTLGFKMRFTLIIALFCIITGCSRNIDDSETITLEGNNLVYRLHGVLNKYEAMNAPGMKVIRYEKKSQVNEGKETDISQILIGLTSGERLSLVEGQPQPIIRVISGSAIEWQIKPK